MMSAFKAVWARHRRTLSFIFKAIVAVGLIWLLVRLADADTLGAELSDIHFGMLGAGFLCMLALAGFEISRMSILFRRYGVGVFSWAKIFLTGQFYGTFAPGLVGVDVYNIAVLQRGHGDILNTAAYILFLRVVGMLCVLVTIFSLLALRRHELLQPISDAAVNAGGFGGYVAAAAGLLLVAIAGATVLWFSRFRAKATAAVEKVRYSFAAVPRLNLVLIVAASFAVVLMRALMFHFVLLSIGYAPPFEVVLLTASAANFAWLLPISIAGLGVREGIIVALLSAYGVPAASGLLVAALTRLYFAGFALLGGLNVLAFGHDVKRDADSTAATPQG